MAKLGLSLLLLGCILTAFAVADGCTNCNQPGNSGQPGGSGSQPGGPGSSGSSVTEGCPEVPMCNAGLCTNQRNDAVLKDPNSSGYIVCQCGCEILMPCPDGLEFNMTNYRCDWPPGYSGPGNNGGSGGDGGCGGSCGSPGSPGSPGSSSENYNVQCTNDVTLCQNQDNGELFAMDGVCNQFYKCAYGCAVPQYCPANLVYDPSQKLCEYPWNYICPWPYTPPSGPGVGPSGIDCPSGGRCVGQRNGVMFTSTTSCGKYVVCECECEVEMNCPAGLEYSNSLTTCTYPADAGCSL